MAREESSLCDPPGARYGAAGGAEVAGSPPPQRTSSTLSEPLPPSSLSPSDSDSDSSSSSELIAERGGLSRLK